MTISPLMQAVKEDIRMMRLVRNAPAFAGKHDTFGKIIAHIRFCRDMSREELANAVETVVVDEYAPASFDEIVALLSSAARAVQQYGATDAQVRYLSRLLADKGETRRQVKAITTLTKGEASIIIDSLKARA